MELVHGNFARKVANSWVDKTLSSNSENCASILLILGEGPADNIN